MNAYDEARRLMTGKEPLVSREEVNRIFAGLVAEIDRLNALLTPKTVGYIKNPIWSVAIGDQYTR